MKEKYDSGDLDALAELQLSPGYALLKERIEAEIERTRRELEICGPDDVQWRQGYVRAMRTALAIPGIMIQEIKHDLKE